MIITGQHKKFGFVLGLTILALASCRSTDKATQACEENNRMCHRGCDMSNSSFSQSKTAHQSASACDIRCEKNYQACLKRAEKRNLRVIGDSSDY